MGRIESSFEKRIGEEKVKVKMAVFGTGVTVGEMEGDTWRYMREFMKPRIDFFFLSWSLGGDWVFPG